MVEKVEEETIRRALGYVTSTQRYDDEGKRTRTENERKPTMTTDELTDLIVELLWEHFEEDAAEIGRINDEDCIGFDYKGKTWFIEVTED